MPFTVKVNWGLPAIVELGLSEVVVGTGLLMVIVNVPFPVPLLFVALIATVYVPVVVGVPEISPVFVFRLKPGGNGLAV